MKNKITDLNNHLFEQLERLNNEDLKSAELVKEISYPPKCRGTIFVMLNCSIGSSPPPVSAATFTNSVAVFFAAACMLCSVFFAPVKARNR